MNIKKRNCYFKKVVQESERFSIIKNSNLLYVAFDDYDGEVIGCNMNLDDLKQSIKNYIENAYNLEQE